MPDEMAARFAAILDSADEDMGVIVQEEQEQIIGLNTDQLFKEGINSKGVQLKAYRNKEYATQKYEMNPLPGFGHPDLFLTGAFQSSFVLQASGSEYSLNSTDEKAGMLEEKYGESIFGLTEDSKLFAWNNIVSDPYIDLVKTKTQLED